MASKEQYEQFFREADKDSSGQLSIKELVALLRNKGFKGSDSEITGYFGSMDSSGDNMVSMEEYLAAMGQIPAERTKEAAMREVFFGFDQDRNGYIDRAELQKAFDEMNRCLSEAEIKRMMELLDTGGDDKCDYEEFLQHFFNKK